MFEDNKEGEAILYYLYMMADGEGGQGLARDSKWGSQAHFRRI